MWVWGHARIKCAGAGQEKLKMCRAGGGVLKTFHSASPEDLKWNSRNQNDAVITNRK